MHIWRRTGGSRPPAVGRALMLGLLGLTGTVTAQSPVPVDFLNPVPATERSQRVLSGSVVAPDTASLSVAVPGRVARVHVDAGDRVEAGAVMLELDTELAELALDSALATERAARVRRDEALRLREEGRVLARRGDLSRSLMDSREAAAELAVAEHDRAQAERREREALLARHRLTAPFAGTVVRRDTAAGEWLTPGTAVLQLVGSEALQVQLRAAQELSGRLQPGDKATLQLTGRSIRAEVTRVAAAIDPGSRTFLVRVEARDPEAGLIPGQAVRVMLSPGEDASAVAIPRDAVQRYPDGSQIAWVLESGSDGDVVRRRRLQLADRAGEHALVLEGLTTADRVVVRGNEALRDGQVVTARRFDESR